MFLRNRTPFDKAREDQARSRVIQTLETGKRQGHRRDSVLAQSQCKNSERDASTKNKTEDICRPLTLKRVVRISHRNASLSTKAPARTLFSESQRYTPKRMAPPSKLLLKRICSIEFAEEPMYLKRVAGEAIHMPAPFPCLWSHIAIAACFSVEASSSPPELEEERWQD